MGWLFSRRLIGLRLRRLGLRPRRLGLTLRGCLRGRRLRRRRCARPVFEYPRNHMEAADDDHNDGRRHRERPQPLRQFFRLSCAGTAGPGDLPIVVRGRSGLRRAARCCDEIRLAAARVGNDRRLRSDHGFRRGDAVGRGRRLARAAWKRAGFQRMIRRQAGVDRCPRRAGRRLREFNLAQLWRDVGRGGCERQGSRFHRRGSRLKNRRHRMRREFRCIQR